jgi:hypothetical protein
VVVKTLRLINAASLYEDQEFRQTAGIEKDRMYVRYFSLILPQPEMKKHLDQKPSDTVLGRI